METAGPSIPEVLRQKRETVDFLAGKREKATSIKEGQGLAVIRGRAVFKDAHGVEVEGRTISAGKIVIATGSTEIIPPVPGLEEAGYLVSEDFMELEGFARVFGGAGRGGHGPGTGAVRRPHGGGDQPYPAQRACPEQSVTPWWARAWKKALAEDGVRVYTGTGLKEVR